MEDLRFFQKTLQADFSQIFMRYNDFVFNDIEPLVDAVEVIDTVEYI